MQKLDNQLLDSLPIDSKIQQKIDYYICCRIQEKLQVFNSRLQVIVNSKLSVYPRFNLDNYKSLTDSEKEMFYNQLFSKDEILEHRYKIRQLKNNN